MKTKEPKLRWGGNQRAQLEADAAWQAIPTRQRRNKKAPSQKRQRYFVKYNEYINSFAWQRKRKEAFRYYGKRCAVCGSTEALQVHHKTYKRLGREKMKDLQILCDGCHACEHEKDGIKLRDELSAEFNSMFQ